MTLKQTLSAFVRVVLDEADANPEFKQRLESLIESSSKKVAPPGPAAIAGHLRKGGRRTPAVIDPVELARRGRMPLLDALRPLDLERLRDIVAQFGMDPNKLVMKWKDAERVRERIIEVATQRATKGDAFRDG